MMQQYGWLTNLTNFTTDAIGGDVGDDDLPLLC